MKKKLTSVLVLMLALCLVMTGCGKAAAPAEPAPTQEAEVETAAAAESEVVYGFEKGMTMADFSFTTYDGKTMSLYEVLEEKDVVLLNFWASWCGPCRMEFPYMEQAYQKYYDDVEIIALSCEASDTDEILADFAENMGISFPVARDEARIYDELGFGGTVPVSLVIDRFGTICFSEAGSMPSLSEFSALLSAFIGDDYTESVLLDEVPVLRPDYDPPSVEELAAVLNVEGGQIEFVNGEGETEWPVIVDELDGRQVLRSGNTGVDDSTSTIGFTVSAKAGDALAIDFKTSTMAANDLLQVYVNSELVKSFGGEYDWMQYAYSFEEDGEYEFLVGYYKDFMYSDGEDCVWIDSVQLLSGAEAQAAVKANPTYPVADEFSFSIVNDDCREIIFNDPAGLVDLGADLPYYSFDSGEVKLELKLPADIDPETIYVHDVLHGDILAAVEYMTEDGYAFTINTSDMLSEYDSFLNVVRCDSTNYEIPWSVFLFVVDGEELGSYFDKVAVDSNGNPFIKWAYADEVDAEAFYAEELKADFAELLMGQDAGYTVYVIDTNGDPVPGVMLQVCDESNCMVYNTDDQGTSAFTLPPYAYELHVLKVPEGYEADSNLYELPLVGGEMVITLNNK